MSVIMIFDEQFRRCGKDEIECNLAQWLYQKPDGERYASVQLSPYYPPRLKEPENNTKNLERFFNDMSNDEDDDSEPVI